MNQLNQKESIMTEASLYREYVDVVRPPEPPQAQIGDFELLSQTIAIRVWAFRSKHSLATCRDTAGFWDGLRDLGLKRNDKIYAVTSWDGLAEHSTLCVDGIDRVGKATVSLLHHYERQA